MSNIQDNGKKTVTVVIKAAKLTSEIFIKALNDVIENRTPNAGRKTVNQLTGGNEDKLQNIKVTENNLGDFEAVAKKYGISYNIRKDDSEKDSTKYLVQFQGKDLETVHNALNEYAYNKTNTPQKSRFSLERLEELIQQSKDNGIDKSQHKERGRKKQQDRGTITH